MISCTVQVIEMLSDVAAECTNAQPTVAAQSLLAVALAWNHLGERQRAQSACQEAKAFGLADLPQQDVLDRAEQALGAAATES